MPASPPSPPRTAGPPGAAAESRFADLEAGLDALQTDGSGARPSWRARFVRNALPPIVTIIYGAVKRIRPKMMTVMAAFMGLLPIMWSMGTGSDVMRRIAAPMVGGLVTSFALELLVYPTIYHIWKWKFVMREGRVIPVPSGKALRVH